MKTITIDFRIAGQPDILATVTASFASLPGTATSLQWQGWAALLPHLPPEYQRPNPPDSAYAASFEDAMLAMASAAGLAATWVDSGEWQVLQDEVYTA